MKFIRTLDKMVAYTSQNLIGKRKILF